MKKFLVCVLFAILSLSIFSGCPDKDPDNGDGADAYAKYSEKELWDAALEKQDIEIFNIFADKFPESDHALDAKRSLRELWDAKTKKMTPLEMSKLTAVIETDQGAFKFKFHADQAPDTCRNFIKLAMSHFYNGLTFHRVVRGFVIQGGDPLGNGLGGPGYEIKAEFSDVKHMEGTVAMARGPGLNSGGSQFYICLGPQPLLDGKYTVFGQVSEGISAVKTIGKGQTDPRTNVPVVEQYMHKVYIEGL